MQRKDQSDENILKLFIALLVQQDAGMLGQINSILHITKGRYVGVDLQGNVSVNDSAPEIRAQWANE